jgi:hypothetical protein
MQIPSTMHSSFLGKHKTYPKHLQDAQTQEQAPHRLPALIPARLVMSLWKDDCISASLDDGTCSDIRESNMSTASNPVGPKENNA